MSKQRNLRKSKLSFADEEEDAEDGNETLAMPPAAVKATQQQKLKEKKAEKKLALLSFDEDTGEEEQPRIGVITKRKGVSKGKSNLQIPASAGGRIPPSLGGSTYTQVASAGEYTAERLKELQKATLKAPRTGQGEGGPSAVKIIGSFKPQQGAPTTSAGGVQQPPIMPLPPPPMPPHVRVPHPSVVLPGDEEDEEDLGSAIPDNAAIRAAKAQRERLRSAHAAPDYIPLGGGGGEMGTSATEFGGGLLKDLYGKKDRKLMEEESGLEEGGGGVRDKDSDEDNELEETIRLRFGPQGSVLQPISIPKEVVMVEAVEGPSDEEETAWAEEQIRKGVRSSVLRGPSAGTAAGTRQVQTKTGKGVGAGGLGFLPPSQGAAVAAAAEEVIAGLRAALQRAQLSQRQAEKNLARTGRSLEECIAGISRTEKELKRAGEKYVYIQELRAYITDVCSMLAEKSPLVEELQEELQRAGEERAAAHTRRSADRDNEERQPAEAAVRAALGALSQGAGLPQAEAGATIASDTAEKELVSGSHIPVELDEFGRDANAHRRAKIAERLAARRAAREDEAAKRAEGGSASTYLTNFDTMGDVTTSESEDEVEGYTRRKREVLEAGAVAFRDAADDFGSLAAIKTQLEEWKTQYPGQYNDAYMSESVPALFAPFVRLELLAWTPLDSSRSTSTYSGFDQLSWYKLLFDYGMPRDGTAPHPGDGDVDLIPRLVRALVLPIATAAVERLWNPLSAQQSATIAAIVGELMIYVDPGSDGLVGIVQKTQRRLEEAVAVTKVPSWPPAVLAATPRAELYLARAFGRAVRLLRSICAFHEVLPASNLQMLAIQQLVAGQLLQHVRAAAADPITLAKRAQKVLDALPAAWLRAGVPRGLEGLSEVVYAAVRALEPAAGRPETRQAKASAAGALAGVLQKFGDGAAAQRLRLMFDVT